MRIEIYVVTTRLSDHHVEDFKQAELTVVKNEIIHEFGGLTEIPNCKGYWEDTDKVCKDNVDIWLIYASDKKSYRMIEAFASRVKIITYQKSQAFSIDGKLYLI
jgi:hypothetical protein